MNANLVADTIYNALTVKHARVYRNQASKGAVFPYVVFFEQDVFDSYPSNDFTIYIDVYDSPTASVRAMNILADDIESLNHEVIDTENISMQLERVSRQFITNEDYIEAKILTMQFDCRVYFK